MKLENVEDVYSLSPTQQGMYFHILQEPSSGVYLQQYSCTLIGALKYEAFRLAWQLVIEQEPVLRTVFLSEKLKRPLQVVRREVGSDWWQFKDWSGMESGAQRELIEEFLRADRVRGFDLSRAPLLRTTLIRFAEHTHRFVFSFPHILFDGWSVPLILKRAFSFYRSVDREEPIIRQGSENFREYIAWLNGQNLASAEAFWKEKLRGFNDPTPLPGKEGRGISSVEERGHRQEVQSLSESSTETLRSMARSHGLTLNTLILGAWGMLLSRYSGRRDIVFGTTVSGRPPDMPGVERMVGLFINTLPLRVKVAPDSQLVPWLTSVQKQQIEIREYEFSPLVEIQKWSEIPPGSRLFDSIVVFENFPVDDALYGENGSLEIRDVEYKEQSNFPLALLIVPGTQIEFVAIYDGNEFFDTAIIGLLGHLQTLLESMAPNPIQALSKLSLLSEKERGELPHFWMSREEKYPDRGGIHQFLESHAERKPDAVAVEFENTHLTYGELNRRANQWAHRLIDYGASSGSFVGIFMERSLEMVIAIFATLKSGAAYVPLDPAYPKDRLSSILEETGAVAILCQEHLAQRLSDHGKQVFYLDGDGQPSDCKGVENPALRVEGDTLAYAIYTSGSTGRPNGVLVEHRNLIHSTVARISYYSEPVRNFILLSSISFDSSAAGIFWTLSSGGRLVLPRQRQEQAMYELAMLFEESEISHSLMLPSLYDLLLTYSKPGQLSSLRSVIVAGEVCPKAIVDRHYERLPETELFNEYGPTEATIWSTVYRVPFEIEGPSVPIGRPIANTQIYLLDADLQPVPIGVPGDVFIGGDGLARGYLNREESTAERFGPHPFSSDPKSRLYDTGDRARFLPDGCIEFLGRNDDQIKIRGHRVELGEIENALRKHPSLQEVAVVVRDVDEAETMPYQPRRASALSLVETETLLDSVMSLSDETANQLLVEVERFATRGEPAE